jgi:hypothetical protein
VRHTIWTGTFAAVIGLITATALSAQAPPPAQQPTQSDAQVVVAGCLRAAPAGPADTAGTSGAAGPAGATSTAGAPGTTGVAPTTGTVAEQKFVLTDAATAPDPAAATSPAGSATAAPAKQTYRLIANPSALAAHTGKKLELTGTIEPPNATDTSPGATLRVTSGKIVAPSCDEK